MDAKKKEAIMKCTSFDELLDAEYGEHGTSASRSSRNYVLLLEKRHFSHRVEDGRSKYEVAGEYQSWVKYQTALSCAILSE